MSCSTPCLTTVRKEEDTRAPPAPASMTGCLPLGLSSLPQNLATSNSASATMTA